MLTLYRKHDCPACDDVQGQLREHRLAHKIVRLEEAAASAAGLPADAEPPILEDDGEIYTGMEAILKHLEQVARVKDRWQKHGADACFCDDDGEVL